jgi:hypothetical protein
MAGFRDCILIVSEPLPIPTLQFVPVVAQKAVALIAVDTILLLAGEGAHLLSASETSVYLKVKMMLSPAGTPAGIFQVSCRVPLLSTTDTGAPEGACTEPGAAGL